MSDRCHISIYCESDDVEAFEKIGFVLQNDPKKDGFAHVVEEEGIADESNWPRSLPYVGFHGSGREYDSHEFFFDGMKYRDWPKSENSGRYGIFVEKGSITPNFRELFDLHTFLQEKEEVEKRIGLKD